MESFKYYRQVLTLRDVGVGRALTQQWWACIVKGSMVEIYTVAGNNFGLIKRRLVGLAGPVRAGLAGSRAVECSLCFVQLPLNLPFAGAVVFMGPGPFTGDLHWGRDVAPRPPFRAPQPRAAPRMRGPGTAGRGGGERGGEGAPGASLPSRTRTRGGGGARGGACPAGARMRGAAYK